MTTQVKAAQSIQSKINAIKAEIKELRAALRNGQVSEESYEMIVEARHESISTLRQHLSDIMATMTTEEFNAVDK